MKKQSSVAWKNSLRHNIGQFELVNIHFKRVRNFNAPHRTGLEDFHTSGSSVKLTLQRSADPIASEKKAGEADSIARICLARDVPT